MGIRSRKKVEKKRKAIKGATKQIAKLKKQKRIKDNEELKKLTLEERMSIAAAKK